MKRPFHVLQKLHILQQLLVAQHRRGGQVVAIEAKEPGTLAGQHGKTMEDQKKHDQWWPVVKSHDLMFILILLMNSDDSIWNMLCDACCMLCDVWYMICDMLFARCRSYSCSPCFDVGKQPGTNRQRITGCLTRPMSFKERNAGVGSSLPLNLRSREFRCRWSR